MEHKITTGKRISAKGTPRSENNPQDTISAAPQQPLERRHRTISQTRSEREKAPDPVAKPTPQFDKHPPPDREREPRHATDHHPGHIAPHDRSPCPNSPLSPTHRQTRAAWPPLLRPLLHRSDPHLGRTLQRGPGQDRQRKTSPLPTPGAAIVRESSKPTGPLS